MRALVLLAALTGVAGCAGEYSAGVGYDQPVAYGGAYYDSYPYVYGTGYPYTRYRNYYYSTPGVARPYGGRPYGGRPYGRTYAGPPRGYRGR